MSDQICMMCGEPHMTTYEESMAAILSVEWHPAAVGAMTDMLDAAGVPADEDWNRRFASTVAAPCIDRVHQLAETTIRRASTWSPNLLFWTELQAIRLEDVEPEDVTG